MNLKFPIESHALHTHTEVAGLTGTLCLLFQFALFAGFLLGIGLATVGFTLNLFACFLLGIGLAAVGLTLSLFALCLFLVGLVF